MKTKLLKLLVVMTISITAIFALGITASAATAGDFTITLTEGVGDPVVDIDYTYADGVLTILSVKDITIKNTNPSTSTTDRIEVADGVSANITLAGVNIDVSSQSDTAAFKIADDSTGNVTITIADGKTNTLKSGGNCAGLQKNGAYISETQGKLTITGICSLIAPGGAGIGGGISSSTITAIGGERGAGIGGGSGGSGSNITITISGGTVTATGGKYGAGIGGGLGGSGSYITISDGTVTATGGERGAGIGGGCYGSGSNIEISGGVVTATGGDYGAGIGGGDSEGVQAVGCNIKISGGTVTAEGGDYGAGIGGGWYGSGSNIEISGGSVKAVAGINANAIGGGNGQSAVTPTDGNGNNVYLLELTSATSSLKIDGKDFPINHGSDGKVYVYLPEGEHTVISDENSTTNKYAKKADNKLEAIGTAFTITGTTLVYGTDYTYPADTGVLTIKSSAAMTISGTTTTDKIVVADGVSANITLAGVNIDVSSQNGTAAFKIADNSAGNVTITLADGTTNTLKSGRDCAGLQKNGEYISETQGKLTITGTGSLTATGGENAAGIGGNNGISGGCNGSNITISGGVVIANGGYGAYGGAGIGGGSYGSGSNITISGGAVTATGGGAVTAIGGGRGAGIGGGFSGSGSNIKISGGKVTATGGKGGAGIGGGGDGSGSYIEISGGEVTATGGTGIGGGIGGSGSYITISGGSVKADSIDCTPTDGTANATPVYLLELDVDGTSAVTINGKAYPTKHFDENKVYIYLPAKTAANPNEVAVGNETTKYCYINAKWLKVVDSPEADDTEFTYDGEEQTYTIAESDYYVIAGNKQTNAGTYTVTVALKDGYIWNDGETAKEYTFTIAKADPVITVTTDKPSDIAGKAIAVTTTAKHPTNEALTDVPAPVLTYKVGANGAETAFTGSFVIPEGTADGTIITITAKTAESVNYNAVTATATVVVTDCKHTDKTTAWTTDSTSHWHVCNYCGAETDKAEHISDGGKVTTPATTTTDGVRTYSCTACGYVIKTEAIPATGNSGSVEPDVSKPVATTPSYTGRPSWVTTPSETTTTTTTTTTQPPVDEDIDDEDIEIDEDTDTTKPVDDGDEPQIKGEDDKTGWDVIADEIADADDGDKIVVDMNGTTEVPEDILEQIQGQDIDLVIELDNGFIWTINGKDVTNPADIDLGVNKGSTIPVRVINAVTGECEYITITLAHNGEFGFKAVLTVDMGDENEGLYANLYWYTSGNTEFICADKINNKGKADLTFTHASEYIIVIDETNHGKRVEESDNADEDADSDVDNIFNREEDDDVNPFTAVTISFTGVIISAATIMIASKRKKQ